MRSFVVCISCYSDVQIKDGGMGETCRTHVGEEKYSHTSVA